MPVVHIVSHNPPHQKYEVCESILIPEVVTENFKYFRCYFLQFCILTVIEVRMFVT